MVFKKTTSIRKQWLAYLEKVCRPVLEGDLKNRLPLTAAQKKRGVGYLEAYARTISGIAPWLELEPNQLQDDAERALQAEFRELTRKRMAETVDPAHPEYCVWNKTGDYMLPDQPVVESAYFSLCLMYAPKQLWHAQPQTVKDNILAAFEKVLLMRPVRNNWLLFTATTEACRLFLTGTGDLMRIDYAFEQFEQWYKGDGAYGDGKHFMWDYYNSFVIHPMLVAIFDFAGKYFEKEQGENFEKRLARYAEILESFVTPDGTYPPMGRSIVYRAGAMFALSYASYKNMLPKSVKPQQARRAITKVMKRAYENAGNFDESGFLTIGLSGKQQGLAEYYICTGSVYLTATAFWALGLPAKSDFWTGEDKPTTWEKMWGTENIPAEEYDFLEINTEEDTKE